MPNESLAPGSAEDSNGRMVKGGVASETERVEVDYPSADDCAQRYKDRFPHFNDWPRLPLEVRSAKLAESCITSWTKVIYSNDDVRLGVGNDAYQKGLQYQREARVFGFAWEDSSTLTATVKGSRRNLYRQTIRIRRDGSGRFRVTGTCGCPVGSNCKHVAAALLAARASAPALLPGGAPGGGAIDGRSAPTTSVPPVAASSPAARSKTPTKAPEAALPPELAAWLERLARAEEQSSEDYPESVAQRLVYVLSAEHPGAPEARLRLALKSTRLLKSGAFSTSTSDYNPANVRNYEPAKFLRPSDMAVLQAIDGLYRSGSDVSGVLRSDRGAAILADILATGRARWLDVNGPVLSAGPPLRGRIEWVGSGVLALS